MNSKIASFLMGVGAGCGAALWLGSRRGRRFRARIQRQTTRGLDRLKQTSDNLRDQVWGAARKGSEGLSTQAAGLAAGFEAGRRAYRRSVSA